MLSLKICAGFVLSNQNQPSFFSLLRVLAKHMIRMALPFSDSVLV